MTAHITIPQREYDQLFDTLVEVKAKRQEAYDKAIDSLARYKFEMFGYWASGWVKYNRLLPKPMQHSNPFRKLVHQARDMRAEDQPERCGFCSQVKTACERDPCLARRSINEGRPV